MHGEAAPLRAACMRQGADVYQFMRLDNSPDSADESLRLAALASYAVLDSGSDPDLDDLVALAAALCAAPISTITFLDSHRQWFKARVGVSVSETSRDISFCAHAILGKGLMVVPDATKDKRFKNNPLVTGPQKIRFYAGAPLITPDGHALGTLCVLDHEARALRPEQKQSLRVLAHHVVSQLELRRHARALAEARENDQQQSTALVRARAEIARLQARLARYEQSPRAPRRSRR